MKKSAFTLIELIIVIGIISLGLAIVSLRFNIVDEIGAKNEIKTFVNDYNYARDMALSSGTTQYIKFEDNSYSLVGKINIKRNFKYVKCNNTKEIKINDNAYVVIDKEKEAHNLKFTSKKNPDKKWTLGIEAVGGYINEKS
ncbi:prepilin-type N-terminal cleavage/methylation domain-containing protein [uncultured Anaerococcus sp.]|uniref:prepilin-type N-terminal cleavage/methylation domain-containing protein n=1 Tax=uncultured Anaerococcus sp. TaxID=293428 RepID=UPI0025D65917|nr:prepilin-type N-terminal cleavage/methylation domain-containing protein [uncultured Anaerococcus sp.]